MYSVQCVAPFVLRVTENMFLLATAVRSIILALRERKSPDTENAIP